MSENNGSVDTGNPAGQAAAGDNGAAGGNAPWYASIESPETRGFAELKGWKDPSAAIESYRNLEKLTGLPPESLIRIPEEGDTEGWKAVHARVGWGAPDSPDKYELPVPEGTRTDYADRMKSVFHELGIPAEKAKALVEKSNAILGEFGEADEASLKQSNEDALVKLKSDWGANFDELSQLADRARKEILPNSGLTSDQLDLMEDLMGPATMIRLFAAFGQKAGEAKLVAGGGDSNNGPMSPEAAQARLDQLGQDKEWGKRFFAGGVTEQQEFKRLQMIVANATLQR